jgi:hypothetical protein
VVAVGADGNENGNGGNLFDSKFIPLVNYNNQNLTFKSTPPLIFQHRNSISFPSPLQMLTSSSDAILLSLSLVIVPKVMHKYCFLVSRSQKGRPRILIPKIPALALSVLDEADKESVQEQ